MTPTVLSLAEKIKLIRKAKGLSLENLAHATNVSVPTMSRIENGTTPYSDELLGAIVKYMEIENAPLKEHDVEAYKNRLWVINDLVTADRAAEARAAHKDLFPVTELPYECDLSVLYTMTDARIFIKEGNIQAVEERVAAAEALVDGASNEALILYHRNRGYLYSSRGDYKNAAIQYLHAAGIESTILPADASLYLNIGIMYTHLGKPNLVINYLERANLLYSHDRTNAVGSYIDNHLAMNYLALGQYSKAKKLLTKSLAAAKSIGNTLTIGTATGNLGFAYAAEGDTQMGLKLVEQGMEYFNEDDEQYKQGLFSKAGYLIIMKKYTEAKEAITQGKSLCKDEGMFTIGFEALESMIALQSSQKNNAAAEYISNIAIPHFMNGGLPYKQTTLWLCDVLEAYYKKHRNTKMATAIAAMIRDIYKEMFIGDVE